MDSKKDKMLTNEVGAPVANNDHSLTAGPRGPVMMQDVWLLEKMAHFDREVIPERRMHAKGWGAYGHFMVTHDITKYTKAKIFDKIGKKLIYLFVFQRLPAKEARLMPNAIFVASL